MGIDFAERQNLLRRRGKCGPARGGVTLDGCKRRMVARGPQVDECLEDDRRAHAIERRLERRAGGDERMDPLDCDERRRAVVDVPDAGLDPDQRERAHRAGAEQNALAHRRIRVVEERG